MQTRQTELAHFELMLREQLARTEAAGRPRRSRFSPLRSLAAWLPDARDAFLPICARMRSAGRPRRSEPAEEQERALAALFAPTGASATRAEPDFTPPRETRRLPNLSGNDASNRSMKEAPERNWGPPPAVRFPMPVKKKDHRGDLVIAGLGVALGLVCALFPWYIFFNQDQFGVQANRFGGRGGNAGRATVEARQGASGTPVVDQEIPESALDLFSTGTLQPKPESADTAPDLDQQPFPSDAATFRLVHIANGRAMIEDDAGLWVVQQGSVLPDSSTVKSIEQRKGRWVLVTSTDRVIEISK
jgi:hypothetical protein